MTRRIGELEAWTERGIALAALFDQTDDIAVLDTAVELFNRTVAEGDPAGPERARYEDNLGIALLTRFEACHDIADLRAAVAAARRATDPPVARHPSYALHLSNRCNTALSSYFATGERSDLEDAVQAGTLAVSAAEEGDPDLPQSLLNLDAALTARFEQLTEDSRSILAELPGLAQERLDEAISLGRAAVSTAPPTEPRRWIALSNTSNALRQRFERSHDLDDVDASVALARDASASAAELPAREPAVSCAINLSAALLARFYAGDDPADAEETIAVCRRAAPAATGADRATLLSNLAGALQGRASHTTSGARAHSDLDEACRACELVIETTTDPVERAIYAGNLANALMSRHARFPTATTPSDVEEAIRWARWSVEFLPIGGQDWARAAANLATAISTRWHDGAVTAGDAHQACEQWGAITAATSVAASVRLAAAHDAAVLGAESGQRRESVAAASAAVALLPLLAWRGLGWRSRVAQLVRWQGLASEVAALAVAADNPGAAVTLADRGRSVLWSQVIELRGDLHRLADIDPAVSRRLRQIRDNLDEVGRRSGGGAIG